jgi:hypothetical protein
VDLDNSWSLTVVLVSMTNEDLVLYGQTVTPQRYQAGHMYDGLPHSGKNQKAFSTTQRCRQHSVKPFDSFNAAGTFERL